MTLTCDLSNTFPADVHDVGWKNACSLKTTVVSVDIVWTVVAQVPQVYANKSVNRMACVTSSWHVIITMVFPPPKGVRPPF